MYRTSHSHTGRESKGKSRADKYQNPSDRCYRIFEAQLNGLIHGLQNHTEDNLNTSQNQRKVKHLLVIQ